MTDLWCTRLVLVTLARQFARRLRPFTVAELLAWCAELGSEKSARFACRMLRTAGMLEASPPKHSRDNQNPSAPAKWQLTTTGWEAAKAAQAEAASKARSRTMARLNSQPCGNPLSQRLWTLLRARRCLTSTEAAELLGDAGADHKKMVKAVGRYLSTWHRLAPELIQVSTQRIGGSHQYVLVAESAAHMLPSVLRNAESKVLDKGAKS